MNDESRSSNWISDSLAANGITATNLVGWERGFIFLSMDRCQAFFEDVGIPARVAAKPQPVTLSAREYLRPEEPLGTTTASGDAAVDSARIRVAAFFTNVAKRYDQGTGKALADWLLRYVVENGLADATSAWRGVFRHICSLTSEEKTQPSILPDEKLVGHVCQVVADYLQPSVLREVDERLKTARSSSKTAGESFVDKQLAHSAGQCSSLSATDIAFDMARLLSITHTTLRLWRQLKMQL